MTVAPDYSALDHPAVSMNAFYPRRDWSPAPAGARDYAVDVGDGVSLSCRFFPCAPVDSPYQTGNGGGDAPTILYFYGNGETGADYDGIAPWYNRAGANFFVVDYRGYGRSGGSPSFSAMLADGVEALGFLEDLLRSENWGRGIFVMGRSMGRHCAFELAAHYGGRLRGVIIESGRPVLGNFTYGLAPADAEALEAAYRAKVCSISIPALVIHGEGDALAPVGQAVEMHGCFRSADKRLLIIPGAGHNDLLHIGLSEYFGAIGDFVSGRGAG